MQRNQMNFNDLTVSGWYRFDPKNVVFPAVSSDVFKFISQTHVISKGVHYTRAFVNGKYTEWRPLNLLEEGERD